MRFITGIVIGVLLGLTAVGHPDVRDFAGERIGGWLRLAGAERQPLTESGKLPAAETVAEETALPAVETAAAGMPPVIPTTPGQGISESAGDDDSVPAAIAAPPAAVPTVDFQVAWTPFRSEISAEGFATGLEAKLGHPFAVRKRGPGRYEVGFAFSDADERAEVLARVGALTGFEPSAGGAP